MPKSASSQLPLFSFYIYSTRHLAGSALSHSVGFSLNVLDVVGSVKIDRTVTQVVQAERCVIDNNGLGNYTTE